VERCLEAALAIVVLVADPLSLLPDAVGWLGAGRRSGQGRPRRRVFLDAQGNVLREESLPAESEPAR